MAVIRGPMSHLRSLLWGTPKGERRFNKRFQGGWPARIGFLVVGVVFLGLRDASSWISALTGMALALLFYGSLMLLGRMSNYLSLGVTELKDSQMGVVTPGG